MLPWIRCITTPWHSLCHMQSNGKLVQASNKIQANSAEESRDDDIIDTGQRKHFFPPLPAE